MLAGEQQSHTRDPLGMQARNGGLVASRLEMCARLSISTLLSHYSLLFFAFFACSFLSFSSLSSTSLRAFTYSFALLYRMSSMSSATRDLSVLYAEMSPLSCSLRMSRMIAASSGPRLGAP